MFAGDILGILQTKAACLPGSRDFEGRPLIIVYIPAELQPWTKDNLELTLQYFSSIFNQETRRRGFTVLVDGQKNAWRVARACIRMVSLSLGSDLASMIVLRPDAFWDKQRVDNCTKIRKEGEVSWSWPGFRFRWRYLHLTTRCRVISADFHTNLEARKVRGQFATHRRIWRYLDVQP